MSKLLISVIGVGSGRGGDGDGWNELRVMRGRVGDGILYVLLPEVMFNLLRPK